MTFEYEVNVCNYIQSGTHCKTILSNHHLLGSCQVLACYSEALSLLIDWGLQLGCSVQKSLFDSFFQFYIFLFNYFLIVFICSLCNKDSSSCTFQACVMPKDCQTSDWSSWSPCSKTCRSTDLSPGYRLRSRIMTQIPVGGGKQCPTLEEKEACNIIGDLLPNCPR